jgi:hypothetical protein
MPRSLNDREIDELIALAREWCELNAAYQLQCASGSMRRDADNAFQIRLSQLNKRIEAIKRGDVKPRRRHWIIPLAGYMQWKVAK